MAFPSLSAAGVPTVTLSRGQSYPDEHEYEPSQLVGYSDANTARVATLSDAVETFPLVFERLPTADVDALLAFLTHPLINWAAESFTYTDTAGVATVVRYNEKSFSRQQVGSGLYTVRLTLRKEPF